ncbi:hypothetical protein ECTPHS_05601 [Ectothiorhodospira sp. PHS-1]|nr:hypothetical protein ECTPHS_05601 [Ectothiorhodospira sp. PHS-1]
MVQLGTLAPQGLGFFGVVPDVGVFQFPTDFFQALALGIEVKDTPSGLPHALADP